MLYIWITKLTVINVSRYEPYELREPSFCLSALENHPYSHNSGNACLTAFAGNIINILYDGNAYCVAGMNLTMCFLWPYMMGLNSRVFISKRICKLHHDWWGPARSLRYWQTGHRLSCVTLGKIWSLKCWQLFPETLSNWAQGCSCITAVQWR